MFKYNTLLDLGQLYCNDIHKIAETYGIEAASKVIVKVIHFLNIFFKKHQVINGKLHGRP